MTAPQPLLPPDTSNMDATLARNWAVRVKKDGSWIWIKGINSFDAPISDSLQEAGDYHSGAWGAQISTEKAWVATIGVGRKLDPTKAPDPGVEYLRGLGVEVGSDGIAEIQWWRTDGLPDAYQGRGTVNFASAGGDKTGLQGGTITITGYGKLNKIEKPTAVAVNEVQRLDILSAPTSFKLKVLAAETSALTVSSLDAATLQTAITGLAPIGSGNCTVTGSNAAGYVFTFAGALAGVDVPTLQVTTLVGGTDPVVTVTVVTQGHPAG